MATTTRIFRKNGISVLASVEADMSSPAACSLMVKHSDAHLQASIVLKFSLLLRGFDSEQTVQLVLDANNLEPRHVKLEPSSTTVPQNLVLPILRNKGRPDSLYLFSIMLKEPCIVRYPQSEHSTIAPQSDVQEDFAHLVHLAKSTQIYILFDYQWLPSAKSDRLWSIVNHPDRLTGFRVEEKSDAAYKQGDWTVFAPPGASDVPPPAYGDISRKRPRQSPTTSPRGPSPKRALCTPSPLPLFCPDTLSPTEKASSIEPLTPGFIQPSPTEKASTKAYIPPSRILSPAQDPISAAFTDTVSNAVDSLVPTAVAACLPTLLPSLLPSLVKSYVQTLLPDILETALAPPPSFPSSHHPSRSPSPTTSTHVHTGRTPPAPPRPINHLHRMLHSHLTSYSHHLRTVMGDDFEEQLMEQAPELMGRVEEEFEERLEGHRVEMGLVREEGVADLERECRVKLEELMGETEGVVEGAVERVKERVWGWEGDVEEGGVWVLEGGREDDGGRKVEEGYLDDEGTTEDESANEEEEAAEELQEVKMWAVKEQCICKARTKQRTGIPRGVSVRRAASEPVDI